MKKYLINYTNWALIVVFFFSVPGYSYCQIDPVGDFNRHIAETWKGDYIRIGAYKVKGSPFLLGESFPGIVTYKDGKTVTDEKILFDLYNQKAGIAIKDEIFERDVPIESFSMNLPERMGGQTLLFKNSEVFGKPDLHCYFNVVEDGGKVTLLKVYKSKLAADPTNNLDKDLKVFQQYYDYYIFVKSSKTLNNIKLRKKDIVNEFGDNEFIKNYISNNQVDFSKETEVKKLLYNYNKSS